MKANIEDIKRLALRIKDPWALCELFADIPCACEAEHMVCQTIHACVINQKAHGTAFSFQGTGLKSPRQQDGTNNGFAYQTLLDNEYLTEGEHDGKPVIFMTDKLVRKLEGFLS